MEIFLIKSGYHNEHHVEIWLLYFSFSLLFRATLKFWLPYGYMMTVKNRWWCLCEQQVVIQSLDNAHELVDRAISAAIEHSKPVYISVSCNLPAIPHPSFRAIPLPYSLTQGPNPRKYDIPRLFDCLPRVVISACWCFGEQFIEHVDVNALSVPDGLCCEMCSGSMELGN
jgi:hypothetical protein